MAEYIDPITGRVRTLREASEPYVDPNGRPVTIVSGTPDPNAQPEAAPAGTVVRDQRLLWRADAGQYMDDASYEVWKSVRAAEGSGGYQDPAAASAAATAATQPAATGAASTGVPTGPFAPPAPLATAPMFTGPLAGQGGNHAIEQALLALQARNRASGTQQRQLTLADLLMGQITGAQESPAALEARRQQADQEAAQMSLAASAQSPAALRAAMQNVGRIRAAGASEIAARNLEARTQAQNALIGLLSGTRAADIGEQQGLDQTQLGFLQALTGAQGLAQQGQLAREQMTNQQYLAQLAAQSQIESAKLGQNTGNSWLGPLLTVGGSILGTVLQPGTGTAAGAAAGKAAGQAIS